MKVLDEMITVWKAAGSNARDIFLMQKLNVVMNSLVSTISNVKVDRITMLPSEGSAGDTARKTVRLVEELKGALGVDLPAMLESATQGSSGADSAKDS